MEYSKKYYSVQRRSYAKLGCTLEPVTNKINIPDGLGKADFEDFINRLYPNGFSNHGEKYLLGFHWHKIPVNPAEQKGENFNLIHNSYLIEMILEQMRHSKAGKPSRFESMFAWDNIDDARKFQKKVGYPSTEFGIFEIEPLVNNIHKGDMCLTNTGGSFLSAIYFANLYWDGKPNFENKTPEWEYLLPLPVKVIKEVQ